MRAPSIRLTDTNWLPLAQDNDAPVDFVKTLTGLGNIEFSGPEEVVEELERLRDPTQHRPLGK